MTLIHMNRSKILTSIAAVLLLISSLVAQPGKERTQQIVSALQHEEYESALKMLRAAIQQSPGDPQLWTMQGVAYNRVGKTKDALSSFEHAIKLAPDNISALQGAAQIDFDEGNADGIPLLERLLKLHPDDLTSHAMIAVLEYQQRNCVAALPHFERAVSLFEARPAGLHAYAACLVHQRQFDAATNVLRQTLEAN